MDKSGNTSSYFGSIPATCTVCKDCKNWNMGGKWDNPVKAYCAVYKMDEGKRKPASIMYNSAPCEFYQRSEDGNDQ